MEQISTHRLQVFRPLYDGNMNLAERIVAIVRNSRYFTRDPYPGQTNFYDEYLTKYSEYRDILMIKTSEDYQQRISNDTHTSGNSLRRSPLEPVPDDINRKHGPNIIEEILRNLADEGILTLTDFLGAYLYIMHCIDKLAYPSTGSRDISLYIGSNERNLFKVRDPLDYMETFTRQYKGFAPFTSLNGLYGMNTFLYLFFNGILPVGISANGYLLPGGHVSKGAANFSFHDIGHGYAMLAGIKGYLIYFTIVHATGANPLLVMPPRLRRIYEAYRRMFSLNLAKEQIEAFIIFLFSSFHESASYPPCGVLNDENVEEYYNHEPLEYIKIFIDNPYLDPAQFHMDSGEVLRAYERELRQVEKMESGDYNYELHGGEDLQLVADYVSLVFLKLAVDYCQVFGGEIADPLLNEREYHSWIREMKYEYGPVLSQRMQEIIDSYVDGRIGQVEVGGMIRQFTMAGIIPSQGIEYNLHTAAELIINKDRPDPINSLGMTGVYLEQYLQGDFSHVDEIFDPALHQ